MFAPGRRQYSPPLVSTVVRQTDVTSITSGKIVIRPRYSQTVMTLVIGASPGSACLSKYYTSVFDPQIVHDSAVRRFRLNLN